MIGTVLAERYRLEEKLGEGGMGVVYRAEDQHLRRQVAVKILDPHLAEDEAVVRRFQAEAQAAARLNHPHICQVYDSGEDAGVHYIVMEYLPEPDLKAIIRGYAPLPLRKVLEVGIQTCEALDYAHRHGVVHRDIKPQNLLFTDEGVLKVADFGLARALEEQRAEPEMPLGTVPYAPPEQVRGLEAAPTADLYSLGAVLYECMTRQVPFRGSTPAEVLANQMRSRPSSPRAVNPGVSPSAEFIVNKALDKEPSRRYRSAAEMLADLRTVRTGGDLVRTGVLPMEVREAGNRGSRRSEPPPDERRRAGGKTARLIGYAVAAIVVLAVAYVCFAVLRQLFFPPSANPVVSVPRVLGKTEAEAKQILEGQGLRLGEVRYDDKEGMEPGVVIEQIPRPEDRLEENGVVNVTVNRIKEEVIVPDVTGMTTKQAKRTLGDADLRLGEAKKEYDARIPAGRIVEQKVKPGVKVLRGQDIAVVVSKGPEPEEPVVSPPEPASDRSGAGASGDVDLVIDLPPNVSVTEDTSARLDPGVRQFIVSISVRGQREGQHIQVIKKDDDRPGGVAVLDVQLNPGEHRTKSFTGVGSTTVEVWHDNKLVGRPWRFEAPPSETGAGP